MTRLAILACQIAVPPTRSAVERDAHVDAVIDRLEQALSRTPADLVLLPELATIEYGPDAFDRLDALAETLDGRSVEQFSALARRHGVAVAWGMPRRGAAGFHITEVAVDADGQLIGHYDKLHMCAIAGLCEPDYFIPGENLLTFDVKGVRAGVIICYDIRFPELVRDLCLVHGADVILQPSAYAKDASMASWHSFIMTRAMENQVYFLGLNRAGEDWGRSCLCPPWVADESDVVRFGLGEELRVVKVDKAEIARVRAEYPLLTDRRYPPTLE